MNYDVDGRSIILLPQRGVPLSDTIKNRASSAFRAGTEKVILVSPGFSISDISRESIRPEQVRSVGDYLQQKKRAELAAQAETVVIEDPNLPFKIEANHFHSFEESYADMKNLDKDCSYTPDMFMAEITRSIQPGAGYCRRQCSDAI